MENMESIDSINNVSVGEIECNIRKAPYKFPIKRLIQNIENMNVTKNPVALEIFKTHNNNIDQNFESYSGTVGDRTTSTNASIVSQKYFFAPREYLRRISTLRSEKTRKISYDTDPPEIYPIKINQNPETKCEISKLQHNENKIEYVSENFRKIDAKKL